MMSAYFVLAVVSLFASLITFFSGFGLGTLLLPAFAFFFPVHVAISLTAIVHFLNNVFKLFLIGKNANLKLVARFGIPSLLAAFAGAWLLQEITVSTPVCSYVLFGQQFEINLMNMILGGIIILFSLYELIPFFNKLSFGSKHLLIGGLVSGFFGGFSGHQGALRSAFLIQLKLPKEQFVATGVMIACMVDCIRIIVYGISFKNIDLTRNYPLLITAVLAAFVGALLGSKLIKKVTIAFIRYFVALFLILIGLAIILGLLNK